MLVSVVIPTFDAGPYLEACLASLLRQTLRPDLFEIVIVDDGSTDETPGRIDALAASHPNIVAIHTEHSGWPGRPRNVGIARARGEFIQFVDQDDRMAPDALRRLAAFGQRHHSDIVLGKVTSDFRGVALGVYRANRGACTIHDAPLIDSLTPHKMFRRSFLHEHGIVFPEGRRRLEDQLFVVRAYFAAGIVSILADEPCYFYLRRDDHGNAGSVLMDPATYYANLRDVIDVVLANTVPGEERARLLRRFCRVEMLGRLRRPEYLEGQPTFQADMFANIRDVFLDVSDPVVEAGLGTIDQLRAQLIRDDRPAAMLELGRRTFGLRTTATIESARWAAGRLRITFTAEVLHEDGTPLVLRRSGSTLTLDPRLTDGVATEPIDVNEALGQARVGAFLRESTSSIEWVVPTRSSLILTPIDPTTNEADSANDVTDVAADDAADQRVVLRGSFALDVETVAAGRRLRPGSWAIRVRVGTFGLDLTAELPGDEPAAIAVLASLPPLWSEPRRLVTLDRTPGGHLCVQVDRMDRPPRGRRVYRSVPSGPLWRALAVPSRMARQVHRRMPPRVRDASSSVWRAARRLRQPKR